jgi:cytochrome P450
MDGADKLQAWRWRVPTPVSLPHRLTKDDTFEGYFLPKDTVIIQNTYFILRNPEFFDSPDEYIPERYLDNPSGLKNDVESGAYNRSTSFVFGAGSRVCPGDSFSSQSMMILMAKLLWSCNLEADGSVDVSPEGFFGETLIDPLPWKMRIVPKSPERANAATADCHSLEPFLA